MSENNDYNDYIVEKIYAGVVIFLCLFLTAADLFFLYPDYTAESVALFCGMGVGILCCVVFIIRAEWWPLLALPHFLFALGALLFGRIEISALSALAAVGIALIRGFFQERWRIKVSVILVIYLSFVFTQFRFSLQTVLSTLGISVFIASMLTMLVLEMKSALADVLPPEIRIPVKTDSRSELFLSAYELSQRDLYALYAVLNGQTYSVIGDKLNCSVSTVKQMMRRIYQQFGVADRSHFTELLAQFDIVPPDWYKVPKEFASAAALGLDMPVGEG